MADSTLDSQLSGKWIGEVPKAFTDHVRERGAYYRDGDPEYVSNLTTRGLKTEGFKPLYLDREHPAYDPADKVLWPSSEGTRDKVLALLAALELSEDGQCFLERHSTDSIRAWVKAACDETVYVPADDEFDEDDLASLIVALDRQGRASRGVAMRADDEGCEI